MMLFGKKLASCNILDSTPANSLYLLHAVLEVRDNNLDPIYYQLIRSNFKVINYVLTNCVNILYNNELVGENKLQKKLVKKIISSTVRSKNPATIFSELFTQLKVCEGEKITSFLENELKLSSLECLVIGLSLGNEIIGKYIVKKFLPKCTLQEQRDAQHFTVGILKGLQINHTELKDVKMDLVATPQCALAQLVCGSGVECLLTYPKTIETLALVSDITPKAVAECIALFTSTSFFNKKNESQYNSLRINNVQTKNDGLLSVAHQNAISNFINAVKETVPSLNWTEVINSFDDIHINVEKFYIIASIYKKATGNFIPIEQFFGHWKNYNTQFKALEFFVENPAITQFFNQNDSKKCDRKLVLPELKSPQSCILWHYQEFIESIVYVSSRTAKINDIMNKVIEESPSLLLAGVLGCNSYGTLRHIAIAYKILSHSGPSIISKDLVQYLIRIERVTTLLELLNNLVKRGVFILLAVIDSLATNETLEILSKWICSSQNSLFRFNDVVIAVQIAAYDNVLTSVLTPDSNYIKQFNCWMTFVFDEQNISSYFEIAATTAEVSEIMLSENKYKKGVNSVLKFLSSSKVSELDFVSSLAKTLLHEMLLMNDVESTSNKILEELVHGSTELAAETLDRLIGDPACKPLCQCLAQKLLFRTKVCLNDNLKRHRSDLRRLSNLLGILLRDTNCLQPAIATECTEFVVSCILTSKGAENCKPDAIEFGINCLSYFFYRLPEWPELCKTIVKISDIYLDNHIPGVMSKAHSCLNLRNINSKNNTVYDEPPDAIKDKINFLISSTDLRNLLHNSSELRSIVKPQYYRYFARYFVEGRAALEENNHEIFIKILDEMNDQKLLDEVKRCTVTLVQKSLGKTNATGSPAEIAAAKTLGAWFGRLTVARNIPIYTRDVDLREMIYQGLERKTLSIVIPFVAKIMECCVLNNNSVFAPPNPWTMSILAILVEMHVLSGLRMMLVAEVERVLSVMKVDKSEVQSYVSAHPFLEQWLPNIKKLRDSLEGSSPDFYAPSVSDAKILSTNALSQGRLTPTAAPFVPRQLDSSHASPRSDYFTPSTEAPYMHDWELSCLKSVELSNPVVQNAFTELYKRTAQINVLVHHLGQHITSIISDALSMAIWLVTKDFAHVSDTSVLVRTVKSAAKGLVSMRSVPKRTLLRAYFGRVASECFSALNESCFKSENLVLDEVALKAMKGQLCEEFFQANVSVFFRKLVSLLKDRIDDDEKIGEKIQAIYPNIKQQLLNLNKTPIAIPGLANRLNRFYSEISLMNPLIENIDGIIIGVVDFVQKNELPRPVIWPLSELKNSVADVLDGVRRVDAVIASDKDPLAFSSLWSKIVLLLSSRGATGGNISRMAPLVRFQFDMYLHALYRLHSILHAEGKAFLSHVFPSVDKPIQGTCWEFPQLAAEILIRGMLDLRDFDQILAAHLQLVQDNMLSGLLAQGVVTREDLPLSMASVQRAGYLRPPYCDAAIERPNSVRVYSLFANSPEWALHKVVKQKFDQWIPIFEFKRGIEDGTIDASDPALFRRKYREPSLEFIMGLSDDKLLDHGSSLGAFLGFLLEFGVEHYCTVAMKLECSCPAGDVMTLPPFTGGGFIPQPTQRWTTAQEEEAGLFAKVDAAADFIALLFQYSSRVPVRSLEANLMTTLWNTTARVLLHNHECMRRLKCAQPASENVLPLEKGETYQTEFMQRPYVRFINGVLADVLKPSSTSRFMDPTQISVRQEYIRLTLDVLHRCKPTRCPGFGFGWLELLCSHVPLSYILTREGEAQKLWEKYALLICDAFDFISSFTESSGGFTDAGIPLALFAFAASITKLLRIIDHDCSEFLAHYAHTISSHVPFACAQMRNIILCACPTGFENPICDGELGSSNCKMKPKAYPQVNEEIGARPPISALLNPETINACMSGPDAGNPRTAAELLAQLQKASFNTSGESEWAVANSLVINLLYMSFENGTKNRLLPLELPSIPCFQPLIYMLLQADTKTRYLLLNAIANHLRFPCGTTDFVFRLLTFFFGDIDPEVLHMASVGTLQVEQTQEQILRVLIERVSCCRPRPWGVDFIFFFIRGKIFQKHYVSNNPNFAFFLKQTYNKVAQ